MALEKVRNILRMADEANTSAIAFNCTTYSMMDSIAKVAEELKKPVIIMLDPVHNFECNAVGLGGFIAAAHEVANSVSVPIGVHLDHSTEFTYIVKALKYGVTSVMYDGSRLSLEENFENTKKVVEVAKVFDADVEAELGRVGFAKDNDQEKLDMYTKVDVADWFCKETGVASCAIAIGSAHGVYKEEPKLDLKRLEEINAATKTPLVLHGGSGIPDDQLEIAFKNGINKFNVGTEFFQTYYDAISDFCKERGAEGNVFDMPAFTQARLKDYLRKKLQISKITL